MIGHAELKLFHIKPQTLKHVELIKISDESTYDTSLESSWLGDHIFLNMTMIRHTQVKLYNLKPQTIKHVEIIKVLDKLAYDTSLESSWLGGHRFRISKWRSQYYKREADWKEAGERSERAWILSDNTSGASDSEDLLVLSANSSNILVILFCVKKSNHLPFPSLLA